MAEYVSKTEELQGLADQALEASMRAGAEWCDVSCGRTWDTSVDVENGSIKSVDVTSTREFTLRAFVGGAQGVSSGMGFTTEDLIAGARDAVAMARAAQPDPDFRSLPEPAELETVDGLFDERLVRMTPSEAVAIAVRNIEGAREVDADVTISGGLGLEAAEHAFASSTGIRVARRSTSMDVTFFCIVRRGDDSGSFYEFDMGRMLEDVSPDGCGRSATEHALRFLGARKAATRRMSMVLGPLASFSFLRSLAGSTNAENIQRRRSFMVGRLGTKVTSPLVSITDDGLIPHGIFSAPCDGEGAPRRRVPLFEEGVFRGMLHNSYTAGKADAPNTGHGGRTGGIHPSNLVVSLGDRTAEEIIADTDDGVYINMGSVAPDPASGDISASVDFGFKIENGKLAYPVINTMVSGDVFEFLANIDAISSDYREEPGNRLPTLRIRNVQVSGSE